METRAYIWLLYLVHYLKLVIVISNATLQREHCLNPRREIETLVMALVIALGQELG